MSELTSEFPTEIFHYTTASGLKGILHGDNVTLWFTDYRFLNDKSEGQIFTQVYQEVCDDYRKSNKITPTESKIMKQLDISGKKPFAFTAYSDDEPVTHIKQMEADYYLCSFCENDDLLDMWRYYSKDSVGYAVGFKGRVMKAALEKNKAFDICSDPVGNFTCHSVVYDTDQQRALVKDAIDKFLNVVRNNGLKIGKDTLSFFNWDIRTLRFLFKHPCFVAEEEVRCILEIPRGEINDKKQFEIKYREQNGILVPYVEVQMDKKVITNIKIGPLAPENAITSTEQFAQAFKAGIKVTKSDLPIRF